MILLNLGSFATEEAEDRPETTKDVEDGVAEEVDVVVGFFAAVVVQASVEEEPAPWVGRVGFAGFVRGGKGGAEVGVEGGCEVMVGPPYDVVDLDELWKKLRGS